MNVKVKAYNFLKDIEKSKYISLISLTVANKDEVLFDFKKPPYLKGGKQLVFSITKSFMSLAFGMAYDQGLIGLDDYTIDYFKNELPHNYDPKIAEIQVKHVLTMTTGITDENNFDMLKTSDWRTYFLSQKVNYKPYKHNSVDTIVST